MTAVAHPSRGDTHVAGADRLRRRAHPARQPQLQVQRTDDAGATWRTQARRDCRRRATPTCCATPPALDTHDEPGLYLGTRNGEVYASIDGGESFARIAEQLPDVLCVRAVTLP